MSCARWNRLATASLVTAFLDARSGKAALDALEITTLAGVAALVEEQRARIMSGDSRKSDIPLRSMIAEVAVAAHLSERSVQRLLADAADLCDRFAPLVAALAAGRISRAHVAVIHEAGYAVEDPSARAIFLAAAIERAAQTTPGRLRPLVELMAARAVERTFDERHVTARALRAVRVVDLPDSMAEVIATIPATLAHGIFDRLTQQGHAVIDARPGTPALGAETDAGGPAGDAAADVTVADTRSMDELRADILSDLLLTGTPQSCVAGDGLAAIRAIVQVNVPVLRMVDAGNDPAVLVGCGPIDAETARRLAGGAKGWERVMTSPVTGAVLAVDRYRPGKDLRRFLRARDERCRFPGCRMPVWRCDLDHTRDAAHGGATAEQNLAHLCRGHHVLKHASEWRVSQLGGGLLEWTSPTGRVYADRPEPTLRFVPELADPPVRQLLHVWRTAAPDDPVWSFRPDGDPPPF